MHDRPGSAQLLTGAKSGRGRASKTPTSKARWRGCCQRGVGSRGTRKCSHARCQSESQRESGFLTGQGKRAHRWNRAGQGRRHSCVRANERSSWERTQRRGREEKGAAVNSGAKTTSDCSNSSKGELLLKAARFNHTGLNAVNSRVGTVSLKFLSFRSPKAG